MRKPSSLGGECGRWVGINPQRPSWSAFSDDVIMRLYRTQFISNISCQFLGFGITRFDCNTQIFSTSSMPFMKLITVPSRQSAETSSADDDDNSVRPNTTDNAMGKGASLCTVTILPVLVSEQNQIK